MLAGGGRWVPALRTVNTSAGNLLRGRTSAGFGDRLGEPVRRAVRPVRLAQRDGRYLGEVVDALAALPAE
jgi:hypothetical protein